MFTDKIAFLWFQADEELSFKAGNLSELLINFTRDQSDKIDYEQFAKIVASQARKWCHTEKNDDIIICGIRGQSMPSQAIILSL